MTAHRDINYSYDALERKVNASISGVQNNLDILIENVRVLKTTAAATNNVSFAEIVNLLNNSSFEWSKAAYTTLGVLPATVTDDNREVFGWYRQLSSSIDLNTTTASALKADGHSTFAANEATNLNLPRWDRINGFAEIGGVTQNFDLAYLLANDVVVPGRTFQLQFEAQLRTSDAMPADLQFFAYLWDDTTGQQKIIQGGNFTVTGAIEGAQTGVTNVKYLVIAQTDSGEQAVSNILEFTNAPTAFSQNTRARINFRGAPGFITFDIYRQTAGQFVYLFRVQNTIDGSFYDVGGEPIRTIAAFPTTTATAPQAYATTRTFVPGAIGGTGFVRHSLTITVPTTYNATLTQPNNQWIRLGLTAPTTVDRQIQLRKIGLSFGSGAWSLSAEDNRPGVHSQKSTSVTSSPSGNTGGTEPPPPIGSGGCVILNTFVDVFCETAESDVFRISISELKKRCRTEKLYCTDGGSIGGRVLDVKTGQTSILYFITTEQGDAPPCSAAHPFITSASDICGTPAERLKVGDYIKRRGVRVKIIDISIEYGSFEVGIPILEGSHICILGGYDSHNRKLDLEFQYQ